MLPTKFWYFDNRLPRLPIHPWDIIPRVGLDLLIGNTDRSTCTMLSHEISKRYGGDGLPEGTIHIKFTGSAGQSLGAWMAAGLTVEVEGDANAYVQTPAFTARRQPASIQTYVGGGPAARLELCEALRMAV